MRPLILYAEDERDVAEFYINDFKKAGFDVNWAKNGQEALELYKKEAPDIIVLDIGMPGKDGFMVAKEIRKRDSITPVLMLTSTKDYESEIKSIGFDVDDFIRKTDDKVLLFKIKSLIKRNPVNRDKKLIFTPDTWLDMENNILHSAGNSGKISFRDKNLLLLLWRNKNINNKREDVESQVWGDKDGTKEESVYKSLSALRKIIANDPRIQIDTKRNNCIRLVVEDI